MKALLVIISYY